MGYTIAIDGPAGAGKSTIARKVAKELGFIYVDTGAMYRAVGLYFLKNGINAEASEAVEKACKEIDVGIRYENGEQHVYLNGEDVTERLRTEEAGKMASLVAKRQEVREKLLDLQRKLAKENDVVMDGRDIGTFVVPDAALKIYLTASVEERARRRYAELMEKGEKCDIRQIEDDIRARDAADMNREFAPLKQAADAMLVDTTRMNIEEAGKAILMLYRKGKEGKR